LVFAASKAPHPPRVSCMPSSQSTAALDRRRHAIAVGVGDAQQGQHDLGGVVDVG